MSFVFHWNDYFWPLVMTTDDHVRTIPLAIALLREQGTGMRWHLVMAGNVISERAGAGRLRAHAKASGSRGHRQGFLAWRGTVSLDAVTPGAFGPIKSFVAGLDQCGSVEIEGSLARGQADARREPLTAYGLGSNLATQSFGEQERIGAAGIGEEHRELVSSLPRYQLEAAHRALEHMGHQLNRVVAGVVAVPVVDRFQVIEVEREQRERLAVATRSLDLAGEALRKAAIVGKPGQRIGERICTKAGFAV